MRLLRNLNFIIFSSILSQTDTRRMTLKGMAKCTRTNIFAHMMMKAHKKIVLLIITTKRSLIALIERPISNASLCLLLSATTGSDGKAHYRTQIALTMFNFYFYCYFLSLVHVL
jgi:hypothetical protein